MTAWIRRALNTAWVIPACVWEKRAPYVSPALLGAMQQGRFRSMVRHAWKHVPFYREAMLERGLSPRDFNTPGDLELLPLINNRKFRENSSIFNAETADVRNDFVMMAGNYKRICWSRRAALQWFTRISRSREVLNNLLGRHSGYVEAYVLPVEDCNVTLNKYWKENLLFRGRTDHRYRININDPHDKTIRRLNEIRPDIVYCYGSHTEQIFKYIENSGIQFTPPRIWVYGSDMMSPGTREHIEETYGCLVYSTYSMNEMGAFSFECEKRNGFHLNTDSCFVRIIDEDGKTVPDGVPGEVVISNLVNKATVLLNYRTGDQGIISSSPCGCGRTLPLLKEMRGRIYDTIYCKDGRTVSYVLLAAAAGSPLGGVCDFQVIQDEPGHICWTLIPFENSPQDEIAAALIEATRKVFPLPEKVEIKWVDRIEFTPGHKKKFVIHRFE